MRTVTFLIGVSASGKSRYAEKLTSGEVVLSSDQIRLELFGNLTRQSPQDHEEVFRLLQSRMFEYLESGFDVILDSTNLSRKRRAALYKEILRRTSLHRTGTIIDKNGIERVGRIASPVARNVLVRGIVFVEPFKVILENNSKKEIDRQVPVRDLIRMYKNLNIPRIGVDVDDFEVREQTPFFKNIISGSDFLHLVKEDVRSDFNNFLNLLTDEYSTEMKKLLGGHDTPYHLEDIDEHINYCINNAISETNDDNLVMVAMFHDLGKSFTKDGGRYRDHQNVSAMYALKAFSEIKDLGNYIDIYKVLETIYQHMNGHKPLGSKNINNNNLDTGTIDMIQRFAKIDDMSREVSDSLTGGNENDN